MVKIDNAVSYRVGGGGVGEKKGINATQKTQPTYHLQYCSHEIHFHHVSSPQKGLLAHPKILEHKRFFFFFFKERKSQTSSAISNASYFSAWRNTHKSSLLSSGWCYTISANMDAEDDVHIVIPLGHPLPLLKNRKHVQKIRSSRYLT